MQMALRRILSVAYVGTAALGLCALTAPGATADPGGEPLTLQCDAQGELDVVVVGRGTLAPGLVVGSNRVVIPYRITIAGTFTPTDGEPQPIADEFVRPAPQQARNDHCNFHQEGMLADGTFVLDGDIWLTYTP